MSESCLFCKMVRSEIPVKKEFENEHCIIIRDINPQAPNHLLAIPKQHYSSIQTIPDNEFDLLKNVFLSVKEFLKQKGYDETGYRLVINSGESAGQSVHHIHIHILNGRDMKWPPG